MNRNFKKKQGRKNPVYVNFGTKLVTPSEKENLVGGVFDSVSTRYDIMNDLMSLGIHRIWKKTLVKQVKRARGQTILDVGGGTGDISLEILKEMECELILLDINFSMLQTGRNKAYDKGWLHQPSWVCGNAEQLPATDMSKDVYVTAFCMRNVARLEFALKEAYRVLKPGGQFICLEFSPDCFSSLKSFYDFYSFKVLPLLGKQITGDRDAYRYLAESIRTFPTADEFKNFLIKTGFGHIRIMSLTGGIASIHSAWRL